MRKKLTAFLKQPPECCSMSRQKWGISIPGHEQGWEMLDRREAWGFGLPGKRYSCEQAGNPTVLETAGGDTLQLCTKPQNAKTFPSEALLKGIYKDWIQRHWIQNIGSGGNERQICLLDVQLLGMTSAVSDQRGLVLSEEPSLDPGDGFWKGLRYVLGKAWKRTMARGKKHYFFPTTSCLKHEKQRLRPHKSLCVSSVQGCFHTFVYSTCNQSLSQVYFSDQTPGSIYI